MQSTKLALLLILPILSMLSGCIQQISKADLKSIQKETAVCSVLWVWYTGSDNDYHYFKTETPLKSEWYKVAKSDLMIGTEFPRTWKRQNWLQVVQPAEIKYFSDPSKLKVLEL